MKKSQLRQLIKEELLKENSPGDGVKRAAAKEGRQQNRRAEMEGNVLATIDELNQFLNGNVTVEGLRDTLENMLYKLNRLNY